MKKLFLTLLASRIVVALYMGNPSAPEIIGEGFFFCKDNAIAAKLCYQRDWVFDRNFKAVSKVSGPLDRFEYLSDQGVLTLNLIDRFELYGSVGAFRIEATMRPNQVGAQQVYQTYDQLFWGAGVRAIIYEWNALSLGIEGAYQRGKPSLKWITSNGALVSGIQDSKVLFHEWQLGLGVSYRIHMLIPYLGGKWSSAAAEFQNLPVGLFPSTSSFLSKNRRKFGLIFGTTLSNENRFSVNIEARLIDEKALTLFGSVKF